MNIANRDLPQQAALARMHATIESLVPVFEQRATRAREDRRVPEESIAELREAGFFKIFQPLRHGGFEADPREFFRAQQKIAEGCMSTAWAGGIISVHAFQLALFDERAQQEVWSSSACISSIAMSAREAISCVCESPASFVGSLLERFCAP